MARSVVVVSVLVSSLLGCKAFSKLTEDDADKGEASATASATAAPTCTCTRSRDGLITSSSPG